MPSISLNTIKKSIRTQTNNVVSFTVKQKSPILATVSVASFMASNFMLPPARSVALGASALAAALSVGSLASDLTEKATGLLGENLKDVKETLDKKINDVTNAMGGNVLEPIKLKPVTDEDKKKMSATKPIMDDTTKTAWDRITKWVSLDNKPTFNGRQSNYDCLYMYGPPGTGKTVFANALFGAVDNKYEFKLANITAGDLMERGAEKLNLLKKNVLQQIEKATDTEKPIALGFFLDEVEGSLNKDRSINAGVVNEYLTFINEIKDKAAHNPNVYILGALATNYDEQVDRASKRDGRVTETLHINYPILDVKKEILDMVVDKLDSKTHTDKIKKNIKTAIQTALKNADSPIKKALDEKNLTGASVENAVIKTQKDIALNNVTKNIPIEFINRLSGNITTATATATQQRTKDEEEVKARQSMATQVAEISKHLKDIADKTGNNTGIKEILDDMGKKFEDMQKASAEDRKQIIKEISKFIQQVEKHSNRASESARNAQVSEGKAGNYAISAITEYSVWKRANDALSLLQGQVNGLLNN